jgi:hypothetical protein
MVADILKRVGRRIKLPEKEVGALSGHSIIIGATQDLLALNIDLASVMQAGRWKSTHMPMRYGEHVLAARGGMARAANAQGRDTKYRTGRFISRELGNGAESPKVQNITQPWVFSPLIDTIEKRPGPKYAQTC